MEFICLFIALAFIILVGLFFEKNYKYYVCIFSDGKYTKFSGIYLNISIEKLEKKFKKEVLFCQIFKDSYSLISFLVDYCEDINDLDTEVLLRENTKI